MWWFLPSLIGGIIGGGVVGEVVGWAISELITGDSVRDSVEEECPEAFKALIKAKKKNAVNVGIFDEKDEHLADMEITSPKGVSKELRVGQEIYL